MFGASDYEFQLADNSSFSPLSAESVEFGTSYQSSNLDYQTQYYWRVRVSGDRNEWSNTRSFTTMPEPVSQPPPSSGSFVQVRNSNFVLDGEVMHFAGTNAYYLPNYEKLNPGVVDRAMDLFQDTGITVVRMWGFYDGYDCGYSSIDAGENVIQTSPGVYSESGWQFTLAANLRLYEMCRIRREHLLARRQRRYGTLPGIHESHQPFVNNFSTLTICFNIT